MIFAFSPIDGAPYDFDYERIIAEANGLVRADPARFIAFCRFWCRESLFFLLQFVLGVDVNHPWLVQRINEVQERNDRTIDLWFREAYKSTIITYGLNIQEILRDPECRIGIFSHTRSIAKSFLRRIRITFEQNRLLRALFPDVLYDNPTYESPKWSEDEGLLVKRQGVYNEATVEAWGVVDSMPTGKHFNVLHYDDLVTRESVSTPEQMRKVEECFRLSLNLGAKGGKVRIIGTHYHHKDLYSELRREPGWHVRVYPAEDESGQSVLLPQEDLERKRRDFGPYIYAAQMLLNPVAGQEQKFRFEWLRFYRQMPTGLVHVLLCDPANSKKERSGGSDYTVFWLWGLDNRGNRFLVDVVRDRLNLTERWETLRDMVRRWKPYQIGYEQYGMLSDIQYFYEKMSDEGFYFHIIEMGGNRLSKRDRILRLVPWFEQGRIWLPERLVRNGRDLVKEFIEDEYLTFPFSRHDDMLDAASRIEDPPFCHIGPPEEDEDWQDFWTGRNAITGY